MVRVTGGATKRVNSANPVAPGARLTDVRGLAERTYAAHALPTRFRLTPLAAVDADHALADAGYTRVDDSWTMVAPLAAGPIDPAVTIADAASPAWIGGVGATLGWSADERARHAAILARVSDRLAVATLADADQPIGWGVAALRHGRACLYDIAIAAGQRGAGRGRQLVTALLAWSAAQGCDEALLQVLDANTPARRLYAALGFVDAYPYHYRIGA